MAESQADPARSVLTTRGKMQSDLHEHIPRLCGKITCIISGVSSTTETVWVNCRGSLTMVVTCLASWTTCVICLVCVTKATMLSANLNQFGSRTKNANLAVLFLDCLGYLLRLINRVCHCPINKLRICLLMLNNPPFSGLNNGDRLV